MKRGSLRRGVLSLVAAILAAGSMAACGGGAPVTPASVQGSGGATSGATTMITGAGSTFDNPLFSKMFAEYHALHPDVRVNYQPVGSGGGQQQLFAGTVDFGASDAPLTDEQLKSHPNIVHIPITVGAVSVSYNLPGFTSELKLSGSVLAQIYRGKITRWNDPAIARLNPGARLPDMPIAVVHRSDGSGTTFIFTAYLSAVDPAWEGSVGSGASVSWPVGVGAKGSEGVAGQVKQTPGAIGYFEMAYSVENRMPMASIQNKAGRFLQPSPDGASVGAGRAAANMPADLRAVFVNAPGDASYPISGFSWVLVDRQRVNRQLIDLLTWMIHDGQRYAPTLQYAALPAQVVKLDEQKMQALHAG